MNKKYLLILIAILVVFTSIIVASSIMRINTNVEPTESVEHNYTATPTFSTSDTNETITYQASDYSIQHMEKLTSAQNANKTKMVALIKNDFLTSDHPTDTIVSAEIMDSSTDEAVFIKYKFTTADGSELTDIAVVLYDKYNTYNYTRCVSYEYYKYIMSGENIG